MQKFIDQLNENPKYKSLLNRFNEMSKGLSNEEYQEARKTFVMMLIASNKTLMHKLADEIYDELNK